MSKQVKNAMSSEQKKAALLRNEQRTAKNRRLRIVAHEKRMAKKALKLEGRKELKIKGGVKVESVAGAAARAGLREGDVLLQIDNTDITDAKQFSALVAKLDKSKAAIIVLHWLSTIRTALESITGNNISKNAMQGGLASTVLQSLQGKAGEWDVPGWNAHLSFKTAKLLNAPIWDGSAYNKMPYDRMVKA